MRRAKTLAILTTLCASLAPASAQGLAGPGAPDQQDVRPWVLVDQTVGMVGGDAIAFSTLRGGYERRCARMLQEQGLGPTEMDELPVALRRRALLEAILERAKDLVVADHARTIGSDPAQLAQAVQRHVDEQIRREKQEAGSNAAFFRRLEEQGIDFGEYERDIRERTLRIFVLQDTLAQLQQQAHLQVSPREMLEIYRAQPALFRRPDRARGALLQLLPAANEDPELLTQRASQLAAELRELVASGVQGEALESALRARAERAGARFELLELEQGMTERQELMEFLLGTDGEGPAVSDPIPSGADRWVVVRLECVSGEQLPFAHREVQERLRERILELRAQELQSRLVHQLLSNAQVWPKEVKLLGRIRR